MELGSDGDEVIRKLDALLTELRYREAAGRFATKYGAFNPAKQVARMVERVEELMEHRAASRTEVAAAGLFAG